MNSRHDSRHATVALAFAAALALSACSGGGSSAAANTTEPAGATTGATLGTTTTEPATTSTGVATAVYPLTGQPVTDPATAKRPALVVKIDNAPQARPQAGLNQADVVYEEIVEGITRLALVFQSETSDPVGPVRSARTTDINLMAALGKPLFAYSGGNGGVVARVRKANLVDVGADRAASNKYYREKSRAAPHNLYSNVSDLYTLTTPDQQPPPQLFQYRPAGASVPATAAQVAGVKIVYTGGERVDYAWNETLGGWARTQQGTPHLDSAGHQVAPQNVVILFTAYLPSPADPRSPEAQTVGSGEAWVFTNGVFIHGTWSRPTPADVAKLVDDAGNQILLTPGRTWVALPKTGSAVVVPAGQDVAKFPGPKG